MSLTRWGLAFWNPVVTFLNYLWAVFCRRSRGARLVLVGCLQQPARCCQWLEIVVLPLKTGRTESSATYLNAAAAEPCFLGPLYPLNTSACWISVSQESVDLWGWAHAKVWLACGRVGLLQGCPRPMGSAWDGRPAHLSQIQSAYR